MLLTITTTYRPATDLGFLLHKNPHKAQEFSLSFGRAHVFYPEMGENRCTAALLVDVDPIAMVRGRRGPSGEGRQLDQYVNDRPYVASSFLSVALGDVYRSAMAGKSKDRPELVETPLPLEASLPAVPSRGGEKLLRGLFEPLGYEVIAARLPLDESFPDWGESSYYSLTLKATKCLKDLLAHLYVLIPVLDNDKHYWVGDDEVEKLLRHGGEWLAKHPEREQIARRYLKHQKSLARQALARLLPEEDDGADETSISPVTSPARREASLEATISLNEHRIQQVVNTVRTLGATTVIDLGCGEGKLLSALLKERHLEKIAGLDVSMRALEIAGERLNLDRLPSVIRNKVQLLHGALTYRDKRLQGFDVATVIEVIEHLDAGRLAAFERVVFEFTRPKAIVVTTPNVEYNVKFANLPVGKFRHPDHRFEWNRAQFQAWANQVASKHSYSVRFATVGDEDSALGAPTQMAVFELT